MFPFEQLSLEMLVVFAFGLMVLGPKDLPVVMRKIGQFIAKLRGMAAEFRASFDELARQSELDELRKEVEALRSGSLSAISASPPDPVYDYKPYEPPALTHAGEPEGGGFAFPPQPSSAEPPVMAEPVAAEAAPAKPARKPRAKKAPESSVADPVSAVEAPRPPRKPRARKPAADGVGTKDAAE